MLWADPSAPEKRPTFSGPLFGRERAGSQDLPHLHQQLQCHAGLSAGRSEIFQRQGTKRAIVAAWTRKEFRNLSRAEGAGVPVPHPIAMKENILVMDLIAAEGQVAPTLKESDLDQEEARAVYERIVQYISLLYNQAQLVHADLSEFISSIIRESR